MSLGNRTLQKTILGRGWIPTGEVITLLTKHREFGNYVDELQWIEAKTPQARRVLVQNALKRMIPGILIAEWKPPRGRMYRVFFRVQHFNDTPHAIAKLPPGSKLIRTTLPNSLRVSNIATDGKPRVVRLGL